MNLHLLPRSRLIRFVALNEEMPPLVLYSTNMDVCLVNVMILSHLCSGKKGVGISNSCSLLIKKNYLLLLY